MAKGPKFYELGKSNGGVVMGVSAANLSEAKKVFKQRFSGTFFVNEYTYSGKVKKGLCVQL